MPSQTDAAVAHTPKFGDWMRGIYASEKNPLRDGMFVRTIRRTGRCNPGTYYELTDGCGKFWQYPRESTVILGGNTRAQAPAPGSIADVIASMRNFADVADEVTVNNAPTAIRAWANLLEAQAPAAGVTDTQRLDWLEKTFTGMTNGERYLPRVMGWGPSRNGRTMREAIDKYMAEETPFTGVTFVERDMPPGVVAEVRTRHDRVTIVDSDDAAMTAGLAGGG